MTSKPSQKSFHLIDDANKAVKVVVWPGEYALLRPDITNGTKVTILDVKVRNDRRSSEFSGAAISTVHFTDSTIVEVRNSNRDMYILQILL